MANVQRHRYASGHVMVDVDSAIVVEQGDLIWLNTNDGRPAGQDTNSDGTGDLWNSDLATTQEDFHDVFLGVAADQSRSGDTDQIRCEYGDVFEFTCASATFNVGDLVGPAKTAGNNLENQKVVAVATANLAIGRVAKPYLSATTTVLVDVRSTVMDGGPQAAA